MTWRDKSKRVIAEAVAVWMDITGHHNLQAMPEPQKREFIAYIRTHYPFGERACFPYKAWCAEVRRLKKWLYLPEAHVAAAASAVQEGLFAELEPSPRQRTLNELRTEVLV